jgi:hypothetical protein
MVHSRGITRRMMSCSYSMHWGHSINCQVELSFRPDMYVAIRMLATPDENSVEWVRVAIEALNSWAMALPAVIRFLILLLVKALAGRKKGRGMF